MPSITKSNWIRPRGAATTPPVNHLLPMSTSERDGRLSSRAYAVGSASFRRRSRLHAQAPLAIRFDDIVFAHQAQIVTESSLLACNQAVDE